MRRRQARASAGTSTRRWRRPGPHRLGQPRLRARRAARTPRRGRRARCAGEATVTGLVRRPPRRGSFTPAERARPQPLVLAGLRRHDRVGASGGSAARSRCPSRSTPTPGPSPPGGLPKGGVTRLDLPNRHLEYALTWYGLALTLIGVYRGLRAPAGLTRRRGVHRQCIEVHRFFPPLQRLPAHFAGRRHACLVRPTLAS